MRSRERKVIVTAGTERHGMERFSEGRFLDGHCLSGPIAYL